MHSAGDLVVCFGDVNGHVGRHIGGLYAVHCGYGMGHRNLEGRMSDCSGEGILCVKYVVFKRLHKIVT